MSPLEELLLVAPGAAVLAEQLERTLVRLVALAGQELQGLLAGLHLLAADDAAVLVLHQILLLQATGGVLGRSVVNLRLGANGHLVHLILLTAVFSAARVEWRQQEERLQVSLRLISTA